MAEDQDELEAVRDHVSAAAVRLDRLQAEHPTDGQARALELLDAAAGALGAAGR